MNEDDPRAFFDALGYTIEHSVDADGVHWASLRSATNPDFVVERYGRGDSAETAAERAQQRWRTEQIG